MALSGKVKLGDYFFSTWKQGIYHSFGQDEPVTIELYSDKKSPFQVRVSYTRANSSGYSFELTAPGSVRIPLIADSILIELNNRHPTEVEITLGISKGLAPTTGPFYRTEYVLSVGSSPKELDRIAFADLLSFGIPDSSRRSDLVVRGYMGLNSTEGVQDVLLAQWRGDQIPAEGVPIGQFYKVTYAVESGGSMDLNVLVTLAL